MSDGRRIAAEERIAHLERSVEELSDVVAGQSREIARLNRLLEALLDREADRTGDGNVPIQRPPHW